MKTFLSILAVVVVLAVVLMIGGCGTYNKLVGLKQGVDRSWSDVENVYQRRADLIPNLVKTVEGAANFEKSTLTDVIKARQQVTNVKLDPGQAPTDPAAMAQFQQSQDALSGALSRLLVTVERYPDLKANANFQELQAQLEGTENRIAVERRKFNETVQGYNTTVQQMPTVLFAGLLGFPPRPYFAAKAGADQAPEVNFQFGSPQGATP
jgi:LemA protein